MMSFAVIIFETSLTKMFSVMFAYHYTFLAIAISFAGLGLGGIFGQAFFSKTPKKNLFAALTIVYSLFSLLVSLSTAAAINTSSPSFGAVSILFFMAFIPAGLFLATAYRFFTAHSSLLYGADIIGASLGSLGVIIFLNAFSPVTTILSISAILSTVAVFLTFFGNKWRIIFSCTLLLLLLTSSVLLITVSAGREVPIGSDQGKELYNALNGNMGARIVESKWSAFGRTDLVEFGNDPHEKVIYVDGGAGTALYHFDGNFSDPNSPVYPLWNSTAAFPFYFMDDKRSALIIGPGGGVDVLTALMFNFSHIHAVEINQQTVDIVKEFSNYDGGIYTNYSNVHVHVDEGRSFLKREEEKFDVIMLKIPITKTIQGSSGYSMAENYLFTVDSFNDFLSHLNDGGALVIVAHERVEIYKLITTALTALQGKGQGVSVSMLQMAVVESSGHPMFPVLILKKAAFAPIDTKNMLATSGKLGLVPVYLPQASSDEKTKLDPVLVKLADGSLDLSSLIALASQSQVDVAPPTDDKPFFYKFEDGLPFELPQLLIGFIVLGAVTVFAYLLDWGRRLYAASKKVRETLTEKFSLFPPFYFASLGLGFMLIEVSLIQSFVLFLGSPALAMPIILFSLLLSMGVGGLLSKKWKHPTDGIFKICLAIGVFATLYIVILPNVFNAFLSSGLDTRLAISFAATFPIGLLLGIPFPIGMRLMDECYESNDVPWMWGINGLYSLLGSVLAVIIAISDGFSIALLSGGLVYIFAFVIGRTLFRGEWSPAGEQLKTCGRTAPNVKKKLR
jgi:predicted membrane-bound spermidine synthase